MIKGHPEQNDLINHDINDRLRRKSCGKYLNLWQKKNKSLYAIHSIINSNAVNPQGLGEGKQWQDLVKN